MGLPGVPCPSVSPSLYLRVSSVSGFSFASFPLSLPSSSSELCLLPVSNSGANPSPVPKRGVGTPFPFPGPGSLPPRKDI